MKTSTMQEPEIDFTNIAEVIGSSVLDGIAMNPSTSEDILYDLYWAACKDKTFERMIIKLAANPRLPIDLVRRFAKSENEAVRICIAQNTVSPKSVLRTLSLDRETAVRAGVASNPSTPDDVLVELVNDPDPEVRKSVAENAHVQPRLLQELVKDDTWYVRETAASNANLPIAETLASFLTD